MAMACCSSLARPQSSCSYLRQDKQRPSPKVQNASLAWKPPGRQRISRSTGEARILCIGGDRNSKEEAARKALEQALGGKKEAFSKWDEQLRKKEAESGDAGKKKGFWGFGGGDKGTGGGGGGSGRGGGDDLGGAAPGSDWEDRIQTALAFIALVFFYCFLTGGKQFLRFLLRLPRTLSELSVMLVKDLKLFIPYQMNKVKDHIDEYIFDLKTLWWTIKSKVAAIAAIVSRKAAPSMTSDATERK